MKTDLRIMVPVAALMLLTCTELPSKTLNHLFAGGLSYASPGSGLTDSTGAQPALGFSLGYLYRTGHHVRIGVKGTWTQLSMGKTKTADLSDFGITHVGLYGTFVFHLFREGWSPYFQADGGMGFVFADQIIANQPVRIDGLSEVKVSGGTSVGAYIPVSDRVDLDISGRWFHTFVTHGFSMVGVQAGIVYAMR